MASTFSFYFTLSARSWIKFRGQTVLVLSELRFGGEGSLEANH